MSWFC
jgi:hypothetical protein